MRMMVRFKFPNVFMLRVGIVVLVVVPALLFGPSAVPTAAINGAPTLIAPAENTTLATFGPTLTWTNPTGTTQYHLQVIPVNNDGPGVDLHVGSPDTAFQIPPPPQWYGLLPDMGYTWRVRASNAGTFVDLSDPSWSSWAQRTFRTPAVSSATISVVSPPNNGSAVTITPTLQWANSRSDVFYYEVQLTKDRSFNTDPATATAMVYGELRHGGATSPPNSYTVPASFPLENNVTYFWRIRPRVQGDGTPLPWSAPWMFTTAQPIQTACIDYSDGTYEGNSANEQGQVLAVLFAPPSPGRWQVTHLRYRISRNPVPFDAAVFSRQQAELARQRVEPTATGLVEVDISAWNVIADGDFYGALVYLQGSAGNAASFGPFIGRDSSMPDGRSWVTKPGGIWKTWRQEDLDQGYSLGDGDFAIIACVRGPV